ncbi:UTP--glucose-1-phosphate uridylyltransferase GalU [Acidithiobacillus thiooxidans]|jgi:UTP--glucose-1-phosphate uridylyltransferase|nr:MULTISPECIES: UTP--glucose-1-phosphate uridylyltransferase GalU [Acidithiobacillus]MDD2802337.1 UTP--glucose-1-phosphate uridylyltransferase GalU [Methylococcales bacterium]MBE7566675.1 UTP--glucose-1-phosphate uridylyltransferase GalU [Acidithiobacillus sp. HP-11]MBU2752059.1 UTP--glucose-1-phosphate uridylyltransferase GalU [Acidithiobacillus thiooxidans]MBU2794387.1 UTP--glucose-1-phosphate uridylyltransferase GalU [Acidithiobacillus thiooxidans]MBU2840211.1 UTP--glucose-1-phosphate urid
MKIPARHSTMKAPNSVRTAVFPVAGMGTRFLPATKATAKEMMPIVDKPLIQYAVEEALEAGCDRLVFVSGRGKRAIADHFDVAFELEYELERCGKMELLEEVRSIVPRGVSTVFLRQPHPLGLGDAVLMTRDVVGDHPFAVLLADDLILAKKPVLAQMIEQYEHYHAAILAIQHVPHKETNKYGIIQSWAWENRIHQISNIIEKPNPDDAPSDLGVVGRYILPPRIYDYLENLPAGTGGEIQLTDGIAALLRERQVLGFEFEGRRFDCGDKLGFLQATVEYGLRHAGVGTSFAEYLHTLATDGICSYIADKPIALLTRKKKSRVA